MWLNEQGDGRRYKKKVKLSACYKETNVHSKKSDNHFILKVKNHLSPQDWAVLAVWMEGGGVFIIALNRQLHMQPWGRHRENLWLVWDCSHLTEGKLLNEKFLCLFDRFVTRKRKILLVKYDRMQMRRCSLWIFAWIYWIIVAVWIQKKIKKILSKHLFVSRGGDIMKKLHFILSERRASLWCGNTVCHTANAEFPPTLLYE